MGKTNTTNSDLPKVSVVIPMRNEAGHIAKCLESVVNQDYPAELIEVIVVDGGSTDGSLETVKELMEKYPNIKLMGGRGVNCPAGMNIGIREASGDIVAKVDAHGYPALDFMRTSVKYLTEDSKVKCVGGPIRPLADTPMAKASVFARSSLFGVGRGVYSMAHDAQFVDTVQCGVYRKDVFREIGLFDESLQFGEDEEINWRIRKGGYKIFSTPEIKFFYFPRNSFRKLFKQYYNYGRLRVRVIRKHPDFFRHKHVIPAMFVLALVVIGVLAVFSSLFSKLFFGMALLYLIVSLTVSAAISTCEGWKYLFLLPISFGTLHFGYGIGFLHGMVDLCLGFHGKEANGR
jgi:glycosyltransferase involved in cell wall biosynthesis